MPRGINVRHDMNSPASRPGFVGIAAGILRQRIETTADAGVGAEQLDRAKLAFGFLNDVADVFLLPDIAFEGRAVDRGGNGSPSCAVAIGDEHFLCARASEE